MTDHFESLVNSGGGETLDSRMEAIRNSRVEAMARQITQQRTMLFIMAALTVMVSLWDRVSIRGAAGSITQATAMLNELKTRTAEQTAMANFDALQAKRFDIVGADGKPVLRFTAASGGGSIVAMTPDGNQVVEIGVNERGTGVVTTFDGHGGQLVQLGATGNGGTIYTRGETGRVVARLGAGEGGDGFCIAADRQGNELVKLVASTDGGSVVVQSDKGDPRIRLLSNPEGSAVAVFNNAGTPVCTLTPDEHGNGLIGAWSTSDGGQTLQGGAMNGSASQKTSTNDGPKTKLN